MLRYVFACSVLIMLYLGGVLLSSEIYIQRLIDKVLDQEETIEWLEEEEQQRQGHQEVMDFLDGVGGAAGGEDRDSLGAGGAGLEMLPLGGTSYQALPRLDSEATLTLANPRTDALAGERRKMSMSYRVGSLREEGILAHTPVPVPVPVHGAAALRRLTMHKMESLHGEALAVMAAQAQAGGQDESRGDRPRLGSLRGDDALGTYVLYMFCLCCLLCTLIGAWGPGTD
ncbi:hypothetical protein B484DRAFT_204463 [Ochromonadaceae sp. CCMP2298]|nr:hypothetical protein B484DRAFT_204463 [Ochromonadaceae sp. CCMP2298]